MVAALPHTATHCENPATKPQHNASHCNTLQHTATQCNTRQHTAIHCNKIDSPMTRCVECEIKCDCTNIDMQLQLQHTASHCDTLRHTATTLQQYCNNANSPTTCCVASQECHQARYCKYRYAVEKHSSAMQHTATHCNTLQRTATRCTTLHHSCDAIKCGASNTLAQGRSTNTQFVTHSSVEFVTRSMQNM